MSFPRKNVIPAKAGAGNQDCHLENSESIPDLQGRAVGRRHEYRRGYPMLSPTDIDAWVGRLNQRRECCFAFGRPRGVVSSLLLGDPMWSPLLAVSSWFPACAGKTFAARHSLLGTLHGLWPVVCQRSGIRTHNPKPSKHIEANLEASHYVHKYQCVTYR